MATSRVPAADICPSDSSLTDVRANKVTRLEFTRADLARRNYRVLLAHDLTGRSEIALVRAARLALERDGHLTVLHVVDCGLPAPAIEARRAHARGYLEAEIRRVIGHGKLPYRIDVGIGDPAGAIAARARAHDIDLVVTSRHRRRGLRDMLKPTTLGRLLQQNQCPVLVVSNWNQSPYQRVLVPIDLMRDPAVRVRFVAAFLPQAGLHLLHAYKRRFQDYVALFSSALRTQANGRLSGPIGQPREQAICRLLENLKPGERRPIVAIENGELLALVKMELARQKTDLLVLGAREACGMEYARIGSAARTALKSSRCDILFLPLDAGFPKLTAAGKTGSAGPPTHRLCA